VFSMQLYASILLPHSAADLAHKNLVSCKQRDSPGLHIDHFWQQENPTFLVISNLLGENFGEQSILQCAYQMIWRAKDVSPQARILKCENMETIVSGWVIIQSLSILHHHSEDVNPQKINGSRWCRPSAQMTYSPLLTVSGGNVRNG
jgi:hypothetical protein